jgi:hypothetical protein
MPQLSDHDFRAIIELHDRWLEEELAGNEAHITKLFIERLNKEVGCKCPEFRTTRA